MLGINRILNYMYILIVTSTQQDLLAVVSQHGKQAPGCRIAEVVTWALASVKDKPHTGRPSKINGSVLAAAVTLVAEQQSVPAATAMLKDGAGTAGGGCA